MKKGKKKEKLKRRKKQRQKIKGKGGNSAGVPPLPIPNRAVKPRRADGTGKPGEQVAAPLEREVETDASPPPLPFLCPIWLRCFIVSDVLYSC